VVCVLSMARKVSIDPKHTEAANDAPHVIGGLLDGSSDPEPRMIGDFDGSANALWTLYGKEAKSHDESRVETLKEDMDGVLIFVRLYFAHVYGLRHIDFWQHRPVYFLRSLPHS
jgi:hypothetical protein